MTYQELFKAGLDAVDRLDRLEIETIAAQMRELNPHLAYPYLLERAIAEGSGDKAWARDIYARLERNLPYYQDVALALATYDLSEGAFSAALERYDRGLSRHIALTPVERLPTGTVTVARLKHDLLQIRHLRQMGSPIDQAVEMAYSDLIQKYFSDQKDSNARAELTPQELLSIAEFYRRCTHLKTDVRPPSTVVTPHLEGAMRCILADPDVPQMIDDFFVGSVASAIYSYLLESTIWHCDSHTGGGYIGSNDLVGLGHPVLRIAVNEIETVLRSSGLPTARVQQFWAFRCVVPPNGVGLHADVARLNLNVWLTPNEYVADKPRAGTNLYQVRRPADWSHEEYNGDGAARQLVQASKVTTIPYRFNRATLFDSRCFHESMSENCSVEYEGLRTNLTFVLDF